MTDRFLKAKHWQLFLLTFGIPVIFQFILMGSMFANLSTNTNPDPGKMLNYMKSFPIIMVLFMAIFFGWYWSVAIGLQKKVPENVIMKVKKFKIFFFIPIVYMICFMIFMTFAMDGLISNRREPNVGIIVSMFAVIVPLHLFSMFCIFFHYILLLKLLKL